MKRTILLIPLLLIFISLHPQTATNFSCKDCTGTTYELFAELDTGKVVVIDWVMPCGPCVGPTLTTYNIVKSYQDSHPGKVVMYLCDDFADTPCPSLISWANSIGVHDAVFFSDAAIDMMDYGSIGMPKVVVIGGPEYKVFFNTNNTLDHQELIAAIDEAIAATTVGVDIQSKSPSGIILFPNPAKGAFSVVFGVENMDPVMIEVLSTDGKTLLQKNISNPAIGENTATFYEQLASGIYLVRVASSQATLVEKLVIR
jgi:hypothetical protein